MASCLAPSARRSRRSSRSGRGGRGRRRPVGRGATWRGSSRTAIDRFGGVDILVNNAAVTVGYNWSAPLLEMPRADWLHHFAVNVHAPFTLAQLVVPSMAGARRRADTQRHHRQRGGAPPGGGAVARVQRAVLPRGRDRRHPGAGRQHEHPRPVVAGLLRQQAGARPDVQRPRAAAGGQERVHHGRHARVGGHRERRGEHRTRRAAGREDGVDGRPGPGAWPTSRPARTRWSTPAGSSSPSASWPNSAWRPTTDRRPGGAARSGKAGCQRRAAPAPRRRVRLAFQIAVAVP